MPEPLPFASVIVPTWNRAELLAHCLRFLRAQDYPRDRYEIVVVDDGSTDGTGEVVRPLMAAGAPAVRYVPLPHGGLNVARNAGLEASKGDPICLVDDDEEVPPEWLSTIVDALRRHPDAGLVGGPLLVRFDVPPPRICEMESWRWESHFDLGDTEHTVDHLDGGNLATRRWVIERVGAFAPALSGSGDDYEWSQRLQRAGVPIMYIPSAKIWHRRTREQLRWRTLLRRRFRQGREWAEYTRHVGESVQLWPQLWPLPFYMLHAVRRRCFGAVMEVARKLGLAWGIVRTRYMR